MVNCVKKQLIGVLISCLVIGLSPLRAPIIKAVSLPPKPVITSPSEEIMWYKLPLSITFQPLSGAVSYTVTVYDSLELTKKLEKTVLSTSYSITAGELPLNQFYYVSVRANYSGQVVSDESYRVPFYLDGGANNYPPQRPTLTNPLYGDQCLLPLTFQWSFQSPASYYELYVFDSLQRIKIITQIVRGKKHTVNKGLLTEGCYYYASVRASYANGTVSDESERVSFFVNQSGDNPPGEEPPPPPPPPPPEPPPETPNNPDKPTLLTPLDQQQIILPFTVTWSLLKGDISHYILKLYDANRLLKKEQNVSRYTNYFLLTKEMLALDQDYFVTTSAVYLNNGGTVESDMVSFRVLDPNTSKIKPTILTPTTGQTIDLPYAITWSPVVGCSFYQVQVYNSALSSVMIRDTIPPTSEAYLLRTNSLPPGQTFHVSVTAVNRDPQQTAESTKVSFLVSKPMIVMATGVNLISNDSVETKTDGDRLPKDWVKQVWGSNNSIFSYNQTGGHSGSCSLKIEIKTYASGDAKWVPRSLPVAAGDSYQLSVWYKASVDSHVVVHYIMSDGSDYYQELRTLAPSTTWATFSENFQVPLLARSMEIFHLIQQIGWLETDDYSLTTYTPTGFDRAMVTISFDDGWEQNVTTALPILKSHQFKSTYFFATTYLEKSPTSGAASVSGPVAVRLIQSEGHEVGSHSVTHPFLSTVTPSVLQYEVTHSKEYLESITGTGSVSSFATPYGDYNEAVISKLKNYYTVHRGVDEGYNTKDTLDPYRLKVQNLLLTTTQAQFQSWVDEAVRSKLWLVLVYHKIANTNQLTYDTSVSDFTAHMNYIKTKVTGGQLVVKKINEVLPGNVNPQPPPPPPDPPPATRPSILTPLSGAQISLPYTVSWSAVSSTYYYTLKIWDNQAAYPIIQLSNAGTTQSIPRGLLQANRLYTLAVSANLSSGASVESEKISILITETAPPPPPPDPPPDNPPPDPGDPEAPKPVILSPTAGAQISLPFTMSWSFSGGLVKQYTLRIWDVESGQLVLERNLSTYSTYFSLTKELLPVGKNYSTTVLATLNNLSSRESDKVTFSVKDPHRSNIKQVIVAPTSGESISLPYEVSWTPVTDASYYQIQVFNQAQNRVILRNTISNKIVSYRLQASSLSAGHTYYVSISAIGKNTALMGESQRVVFSVIKTQ